MKRIRLLIVTGLAVLMASAEMAGSTLPNYPAAASPARKLYLGEKLVYGIRYLGIPVGKAEGEIKEISEIEGRQAYHIVVRVSSYPVIDLVYKVRDEHHTFIDVETHLPLRYEKNMKQGEYQAALIIRFDRKAKKAYYEYPQSQRKAEVDLLEGALDQLAAGYWFRLQDIRPDSSYEVPVNADEKNWAMKVVTRNVSKMEIDDTGIFQALLIEPEIEFVGLFVKKGRVRGWLSLDERRIPLKMKVKVPVLGHVTAELKEYIPGKA